MPPLSLEDRANHGSLRQLLSQVDGAALLSPSAELLDVGVYLRASAAAYEAVMDDPDHGTRHASARRFSFDTEGALVFVVSQDWPITVYLKGNVVASIRSWLEKPGEDNLAWHGEAP